MKTLIQKLPLDKDCSFVARTYRTPYFETPYHQHNEYELMLVKEGYGTAFVGNSISDYNEGDVFLHGANLPHWFRKKHCTMTASSLVIQFRHDFLGDKFMEVPETGSIRRLLLNSSKGLYLMGDLKAYVGKMMMQFESEGSFYKLIDLLKILYHISISDEYRFMSESDIDKHSISDQGLIHEVFEYSMQNFQRKIAVEEVASLTNKSISAFCQYFKKNTKLTYVEFLTQIRIAHACRLLKETELSVTEICYESGFHNWANFSAHFKKFCKMSPTAYRTNLRQN
ncbi:MAG: AraC family transcriptional regulator [Bacteroidales bacterium]|nr:AraC family transcriptional regulator [Bacteroidales bacterium]